MKLNQPVKILDTWRNSKGGNWTRRHVNNPGFQRGAPWPYVVFGLLPVGLAVLYLNKFWATLVVILSLITLVSMAILIMSAQEKKQ